MDEISRGKWLKQLYDATSKLDRAIGTLEVRLTGTTKSPVIEPKGQPSKAWINDEDDLAPKRRKFVEEYPKDMNATRAAIRAGYSERTASVRGCMLLKDKRVVIALRKEWKKMTDRNAVEKDQVLRELASIAYSNMADFASWDDSGVQLTPSNVLSRFDTAAIKEISETTSAKSTTVKIRLYDKPQALLSLARYLGILDGGGDKKDPQKVAEEIRKELGVMMDSVPGKPEVPDELPDNVRRLGKKIGQFEERIVGAE